MAFDVDAAADYFLGRFILDHLMAGEFLAAFWALEVASCRVFNNSVGMALYERAIRALAVFIKVLVTARAVDLYHICVGATVDIQSSGPFSVRCVP